jgi:glutaminyl-tRNA synthetase
MDAIDNPEDPQSKTHQIEFSRELWIEREDFMEDAPKNFFRLSVGREVRLKNAYIVKCTGIKKNEAGEVEEIFCEYDANTKSGMPDANRKVKATLHWLSRNHCVPAEVRLYDRLFMVENPSADERDFRELLNPESLEVRQNCYVEKYLQEFKPLDYLQFQRLGYFTLDKDSTPDHLVFNRTVGLRDNWAKAKK